MKTILVTGASGLIGKSLVDLLLAERHKVKTIGRSSKSDERFQSFVWNYKEDYIEEGALDGVDVIIHLAGANISSGRWTPQRKKEIVDSRVETTELLFRKVKEQDLPIKSFISASAIGYYGAVTNEFIYSEEDAPHTDFIADVCVKWEQAAKRFEEIGISTTILRTGVVFGETGSALQKLTLPIKYGVGSPIGSGKQYMPWIHIEDLCEMYLGAVDNKIKGIYNAVAPNHATNKDVVKTAARVMRRPCFMPNVPTGLMRTIFGAMSAILLEGSRVSAQKIENSGYTFKFPKLESALEDLLK